MIFLLVLIFATVAFLAAFRPTSSSSTRRAARFGMAAAMIFAGVAHWLMPTPFIQHLPEWVPAAEALVAATGGIEIMLGAALLARHPWRRWAGLALAVYFVGVFPANVYVAVADIDVDGQPGGVYSWLRLPLQVLFIVWALWCTDWHLARRRSAEASPRAFARGLE